MARHWAINGRFLTQPLTGVQRYAIGILHSLDELIAAQSPLARDLEVELLVPSKTKVPRLKAVKPRMVGPLSGQAWEQLVLPAYIKSGLISLCNTGPLAVRRQILCIHDVNTRNYARSYSARFRFLYRLLLPVLGDRVARIATVSQYSSGELVRWGIARQNKIAILPNGHEHASRWVPRHSEQTRAVAGPDTIVVIGSAAPHKNTQLILGIADRLAAAGLRVALVGGSDSRVFNEANSPHAAGNVLPLGRLSDEELSALLRECLCLAFPSFVEGFGLPPLEAMATGCPVVVSDRASLPEICANAALYASPDDPGAWLDCFIRLRSDPDLRNRLVERGRARAALFSWKLSAQGYLEEMAALDGLHVSPCKQVSEVSA